MRKSEGCVKGKYIDRKDTYTVNRIKTHKILLNAWNKLWFCASSFIYTHIHTYTHNKYNIMILEVSKNCLTCTLLCRKIYEKKIYLPTYSTLILTLWHCYYMRLEQQQMLAVNSEWSDWWKATVGGNCSCLMMKMMPWQNVLPSYAEGVHSEGQRNQWAAWQQLHFSYTLIPLLFHDTALLFLIHQNGDLGALH